jgi:hypothetical protein
MAARTEESTWWTKVRVWTRGTAGVVSTRWGGISGKFGASGKFSEGGKSGKMGGAWWLARKAAFAAADSRWACYSRLAPVPAPACNTLSNACGVVCRHQLALR